MLSHSSPYSSTPLQIRVSISGMAPSHNKGSKGSAPNMVSALQQTHQSATTNGTSQTAQLNHKPSGGKGKNTPLGVMLKVRLLPPGMLETEFLNLLPTEWHQGNGKVYSFRYNKGKASNRPGKPSHGSVAYLNVLREEDIIPLSESVKKIVWEDAADTHTDPCLKTKPYVERCSYRKTTTAKDQTDALQGTIDQDPEFQAFLVSLTEVATKEKVEDKTVKIFASADKATEKAKTITPLIEFIREKKESTRNKRGKQEEKETKAKPEERKKSRRELRAERAAENLRILKNGTPASSNSREEAAPAAPPPKSLQAVIQEALHAKSKRSGIAAVARLLQRDHQMSPGAAHRRARAEVSKAESEQKAAAAAASAAVTPPPAPAKKEPAKTTAGPNETTPSTEASAAAKGRSSARNRGRRGRSVIPDVEKPPQLTKPVVLLKKKPETTAAESGTEGARSTAPTGEQGSGNQKYTGMILTEPAAELMSRKNEKRERGKGKEKEREKDREKEKEKEPEKENEKEMEKTKIEKDNKKPNPPVTPGSTQAFIKPVGTSIGVTESILRTALSSFGMVNSLQMNLRKGYAYAEFAKSLSLVAAAKASPVTIGSTSVTIIERKDKKAVAAENATIKATSSSKKKGGVENGEASKGFGEKEEQAPKREKGNNEGKEGKEVKDRDVEVETEEGDKKGKSGGRKRMRRNGGRRRGEKGGDGGGWASAPAAATEDN